MLTLRIPKGIELTFEELDANFMFLQETIAATFLPDIRVPNIGTRDALVPAGAVRDNQNVLVFDVGTPSQVLGVPDGEAAYFKWTDNTWELLTSAPAITFQGVWGQIVGDVNDQPDVVAQQTVIRNTLPVTFTVDALAGEPTALTANITFDFTGARRGVTVEMRHNAPTAPTFPAAAKIANGSRYVTGQDNIILFRYISNTEVRVYITQLGDNVL